MKNLACIFFALTLLFSVPGCAKAVSPAIEPAHSPAPSAAAVNSEPQGLALKLLLNGAEVPVIWQNCAAVDALIADAAAAPITVDLSLYGGWEQVGSLGRSYPQDDRQMTAVNGDIVLYQGDKIVLFYGSNSWSYTKIGKIDLPEEEVTTLLSKAPAVLTLLSAAS